jgi:hypothetical protein
LVVVVGVGVVVLVVGGGCVWVVGGVQIGGRRVPQPGSAGERARRGHLVPEYPVEEQTGVEAFQDPGRRPRRAGGVGPTQREERLAERVGGSLFRHVVVKESEQERQ